MDQTHAWHNQADEKWFLAGENFIWYFSNCFLRVSPQTFISPDNMPQSLCALSVSFPLLFFHRNIHLFCSNYTGPNHSCKTPTWLHFRRACSLHERKNQALSNGAHLFFFRHSQLHFRGIKKKKKGCYFNFLFPRQNYILSTNSPPHCPLTLLIFSWQHAWKTLTQLSTQVKALVNKSFIEGQEMHGARTAGLHHDFRIHQPLPICQKPVTPSHTALALWIPSLHSTLCLLLHSEPGGSQHPSRTWFRSRLQPGGTFAQLHPPSPGSECSPPEQQLRFSYCPAHRWARPSEHCSIRGAHWLRLQPSFTAYPSTVLLV